MSAKMLTTLPHQNNRKAKINLILHLSATRGQFFLLTCTHQTGMDVVGWSGFAIAAEVTHASRACQYIQQKYQKIPFVSLPPSKDGVLVFVRPTEVLTFCSETPKWIQEILLDLLSDSLITR